jgi:ribosomal protein S18 acetylase RimI-like enzyme
LLHIARTADMGLVRELFEEYGRALGVDLSFQNFEQELGMLPGDYEPILLATFEGTAAGCVALRHIDETTCEMKRLYVRPVFRGHAIGRALATAIITEAQAQGFRKMRLDTLPAMREAMSLYTSLGFADIEAYRYNPIAGSRYMELDLSRL